MEIEIKLSLCNERFCTDTTRGQFHIEKKKSKTAIFWVVTPRSPIEVNQHFVGMDHLYLQGQRINR
jgi:hypothetical protein